MQVGNFKQNPVLYGINETSSHLNKNINEIMDRVDELDKKNSYISKKYFSKLDITKSSTIDSGKLIIYDDSVIELAYRNSFCGITFENNFERVVRYTPLHKFKEKFNDTVIEAGVERVLTDLGKNSIEEYLFHDIEADKQVIVRDGYVLKEPLPIRVIPELYMRQDMSRVVQRKLNKL